MKAALIKPVVVDLRNTDAGEKLPFCDDRRVLLFRCGEAQSEPRQYRFEEVVDREFVGLARESALQRRLADHAARLGATRKVRARVRGFDAVCEWSKPESESKRRPSDAAAQ